MLNLFYAKFITLKAHKIKFEYFSGNGVLWMAQIYVNSKFGDREIIKYVICSNGHEQYASKQATSIVQFQLNI